jgi:hypothetical protein
MHAPLCGRGVRYVPPQRLARRMRGAPLRAGAAPAAARMPQRARAAPPTPPPTPPGPLRPRPSRPPTPAPRRPAAGHHGAPLRQPHDDLQPRGAPLPGRVCNGGDLKRGRRDRVPREGRRRADRGEEDHIQGARAGAGGGWPSGTTAAAAAGGACSGPDGAAAPAAPAPGRRRPRTPAPAAPGHPRGGRAAGEDVQAGRPHRMRGGGHHGWALGGRGVGVGGRQVQ